MNTSHKTSRSRSRLAVPFLLLLIIALGALLISSSSRPSKSLSFSGSARKITMEVEAPTIISNGPRKKGDTYLSVPCSAIEFSGTRMDFKHPKTQELLASFTPDKADHIGFFAFDEPTLVGIRLVHGTRVSFLEGDSILENPAFDEILEKHPTYFHYAILINEPQEKPIWETSFPLFGEAEPDPNGPHGWIFGYEERLTASSNQTADGPLNVSGHYFERSNWQMEFPPPVS